MGCVELWPSPHDTNPDLGEGWIDDVGVVAGARHEGIDEVRHGRATANVLTDLGPRAGVPGTDRGSVEDLACVGHYLGVAPGQVRQLDVDGKRRESRVRSNVVERCDERGFVTGVGCCWRRVANRQ